MPQGAFIIVLFVLMQPKNNEKEKQKYKRDKAWANLPREEQKEKGEKREKIY